MGFLDHLDALRGHLFRSLIAIVVCGLLFFIFQDFTFRYVIFGPMQDEFPSYRFVCWLSDVFGRGDEWCFKPVIGQNDLIAIGLGEPFMIAMQVALVLGMIVAFPYILWEFWRFVKPALHPNEQKKTSGVVIVCTSLFMVGVLFGYFILTPLATNFLFTYTIPYVKNTPTASSYITNLLMFTLPMGLIFELPVLVYFLSKLGLITHLFMRQYRRHAIVVILIVAAVVTPSPDIFSQLVVFIPLYGLYEASIFIAKRETLKSVK